MYVLSCKMNILVVFVAEPSSDPMLRSVFWSVILLWWTVQCVVILSQCVTFVLVCLAHSVTIHLYILIFFVSEQNY